MWTQALHRQARTSVSGSSESKQMRHCLGPSSSTDASASAGAFSSPSGGCDAAGGASGRTAAGLPPAGQPGRAGRGSLSASMRRGELGF